MNSYGEQSTVSQLREQFEDAAFRLAFQLSMEEQAFKNAHETPEEKQFIDDNEASIRKHVIQQIDRRFRWLNIKAGISTFAPKYLRVAASLLLIVYLGTTVAFAIAPAARTRILQMLMSYEKGYILVQPEMHDAPDTPLGWEGDYYPTYIPDGFQLTHHDQSIGIVWYESGDQWLSFSIHDENTSSTINNEEDNARSISINGHSGIMTVVEDVKTLAWSEYRYYFVISSTVDTDTIIKVAESITRVK